MSRTMACHTPSGAWYAQEASWVQYVPLLKVVPHFCPTSQPESGIRLTPYLYGSNAICPTCPTLGGGKVHSKGKHTPRYPLPSYKFWGEKSGTSGPDCLTALFFNGFTCPTWVLECGAAPPTATPNSPVSDWHRTVKSASRCWDEKWGASTPDFSVGSKWSPDVVPCHRSTVS